LLDRPNPRKEELLEALQERVPAFTHRVRGRQLDERM